MNPVLRIVPTVKQSDQAIAESHGFSVESYVPRDYDLHIVPVATEVAYYFVDPAGNFGPNVKTEQAAWELAAVAARGRADRWAAKVRDRQISAVTDSYVPLDERPLFGCPTEDDAMDVINPAKAAADEAAKRSAAQVARSNRLADLKIRLEVDEKGLPTGRDKNLEIIKNLVRRSKDDDPVVRLSPEN